MIQLDMICLQWKQGNQSVRKRRGDYSYETGVAFEYLA